MSLAFKVFAVCAGLSLLIIAVKVFRSDHQCPDEEELAELRDRCVLAEQAKDRANERARRVSEERLELAQRCSRLEQENRLLLEEWLKS